MTSVSAPPDAYVADPPRLVRQRHIRRGWVGVGVLAIVLAALGSVTLFRAIGPSHEYLAIARDVSVGAQITPDDLTVVRINNAPGLSPVPASEVREVIGSYAAVPLTAGTLLTRAQLTDERVPGPGEQLVAIGLPRDRLPAGSLRAGVPVLLVATSGPAAVDPDAQPRTFNGRVHHVQPAAGRSNDMVISLVVPARDGAVVASLAAAGRLTVVLVPDGGQ
jgi:hypothetical protein